MKIDQMIPSPDQIPIILFIKINNMQMITLSGAVDTSLIISLKDSGSIPGEASFFFAFFKFNRTRSTWRHVIRFRKSPSVYANTQRVTQPAILLCLFQVIIKQNMINYKYL